MKNLFVVVVAALVSAASAHAEALAFDQAVEIAPVVEALHAAAAQDKAVVRGAIPAGPFRLRYRVGKGGVRHTYRCQDNLGRRGYNQVSNKARAWATLKDLECADLSGLRNTGTLNRDLSGVNLRGALLRGAHLSAPSLRGANLEAADLSETVFFARRIRGPMRASVYPDFTGAKLYKTNLLGADLSAARLDGADLRYAKFNQRTRLPFPEAEALRRGMIKMP